MPPHPFDRPAGPPHERPPDDPARTIPVVREEAHLGKEIVDRGSVRVVTSLEERIERVDAPVITEDAVVERVPINRPVSARDLPRVREEGDTIVIPVLDEEVVIERRYVLREEVRIRRDRRVHPRTQDVLLQGQRVVVERHDAHGRPVHDLDQDAASPAPSSPSSKEKHR